MPSISSDAAIFENFWNTGTEVALASTKLLYPFDPNPTLVVTF